MLAAAELAEYDVLLTVDQGIPQQQNLKGRNLAIIVIRSQTSQMEELLPLVDTVLDTLKTIRPGQILAVPSPDEGRTQIEPSY